MKRTPEGLLVAPFRLRAGDGLVFADGTVLVAPQRMVYAALVPPGVKLPVIRRRRSESKNLPEGQTPFRSKKSIGPLRPLSLCAQGG